MRKGTNKIRRHGLMLFTSKRDHAVTSCIWFSQHVNMCCSHRRRLLFGRAFAWRKHTSVEDEAKTKERKRERETKICDCEHGQDKETEWLNAARTADFVDVIFFRISRRSKGGVRVFCYFATRQSADYNANVYGFFFVHVVAARSLGSSLPKWMPLSDSRLSGQTCHFALTYVQ